MIGTIEALFRYPIKSMAAEQLDSTTLGWHGLAGDRRLALYRTGNPSGMPWLTASRLPDLIRYVPCRLEDNDRDLPTHVRTPDGEDLPVFGEELTAEITRRHGAPVQMTHISNGIFDVANVSVITSDTVREIGRLAGRELDVRRFRPNVVVRLLQPAPFREDAWLGGALSFGEGNDAPAINITMRDIRCSIVNLDPETATAAPEILKTVVRAHENCAGVYGSVTRIGRLAVGQPVFLRRN